MYRELSFIAAGRHNVIRRSKKAFNSAISFSPPLLGSAAGIAVSSRASQPLPDPSGEAQLCVGQEGGQRGMGREGRKEKRKERRKDSGGSARGPISGATCPPGVGAVAAPGCRCGTKVISSRVTFPCFRHISCLASIGC